jgi:hypothetical protein
MARTKSAGGAAPKNHPEIITISKYLFYKKWRKDSCALCIKRVSRLEQNAASSYQVLYQKPTQSVVLSDGQILRDTAALGFAVLSCDMMNTSTVIKKTVMVSVNCL